MFIKETLDLAKIIEQNNNQEHTRYGSSPLLSLFTVAL